MRSGTDTYTIAMNDGNVKGAQALMSKAYGLYPEWQTETLI